mmetsp:Transcript_3990/g.7003  ORF Transcript_3990/g.7003 Transcript_3990/m.7003 type:complete len:250 (-) Transcript_3990:218-967(-)
MTEIGEVAAMAVTGRTAVATVFVNGIFNPKDDVSWRQTQKELEAILQAPAHEVHNPTLAIAPEAAIDALAGNSKLALGAGLLALGVAAFGAFSDSATTARVVAASLDSARSKLQSKADVVSAKIGRQVEEMLQSLDSNSDGQVVNLVGHSHGGWCIQSFANDGTLGNLAETYGVTFDVYILGCPVLVKRVPGVGQLVQLHNDLDLVSLRYAPEEAVLEESVVTEKVRSYHSCHSYLKWLKRYLAPQSRQ